MGPQERADILNTRGHMPTGSILAGSVWMPKLILFVLKCWLLSHLSFQLLFNDG